MAMTLLISVIVFVATFVLTSIAEVSSSLTVGEELTTKLFVDSNNRLRSPLIILKDLLSAAQENGRAIVIGLVPAMANFLLTAIPDLAILMTVILFGTMVYLCWWFRQKFESVLEIMFFIIMELILFWELKASISVIVASAKMTGIWRDIVLTTPTFLLIATTGFFIVSALLFREKIQNKKRLWSRITAAVTIFVLVLTAAVSVKGEELPITKAEAAPWYHFYNLDLQGDEDESDDFNFGPTAYKEEKVKGRTIVKTTAEDANKEFRERIQKDPALGAAVISWLDAIVGTRFTGSFYDEVDKQWDAAINKAKQAWFADEQKYKEVYERFFLFLDKAVKTEIIERISGLDDQMYMNPITDGVPDVIVKATENHSGHFLRYIFKIKGKEFSVEYRLECGFQPCNVEKVMKIVPKNKKKVVVVRSSSSSSDGGSNSSGGGGDNPPKLKDPNRSTVLTNDDSGPGENTNNLGSNYSTEDLTTNSDHMTYSEYKQDVQELAQINEVQKVGGDPNTPTTATPPDTTAHSNAEEGTGNGGLDTTSTVSTAPTADETQTATTIEGDVATNAGEQLKDSSGQPWGGPKD